MNRPRPTTVCDGAVSCSVRSCQKAHREVDVLAKELEACRRELELVSSVGARVAAKKVRQVRIMPFELAAVPVVHAYPLVGARPLCHARP